MRSFRPRFTVRRMMVVVALTALFVYGGMESVRLWKVSLLHRQTAKMYAKAEQGLRSMAAFSKAKEIKDRTRSFGATDFGQRYGIGPGVGTKYSDMSREWEAQADRYARLVSAFERAARSPWRPVEPE